MDDELLPPSVFAEAMEMDTTSERLTELATYATLQPLIAANPNAPAMLLAQLSRASNPEIRRAVAQNPNASVQVLCHLAGEFPHEFLLNPLLPILNMTDPQFIKSMPSFSWISLLRFENLSPSWLQQITANKSFQYTQRTVWRTLRLHVTQKSKDLGPWRARANSDLHDYRKKPSLPVSINQTNEIDVFRLFVLLFPHTAPMLKKQWVEAARAQPHATGVALASSLTVGSKTLNLLINEKSMFVRRQAIRHPQVSPKILAGLTKHGRSEIRRAVASNPHTPLENMYTLISDSDSTVRRAAVTHPSLTSADYEMILLDVDDSVRATLAVLPQLAHALLTQLASDPTARVRVAVARNSKAPAELLTTLAYDPDPTVRAAAAGNSRLPLEVQSVLLTDPEEIVRAHLSGNARLLEQCATQLAQDSSLMVRKYLAANSRTPAILLDQLWQTGEMEIWRGLARHAHISPELLVLLAQQGDTNIQALVAAHKHTPVEVLHELAQQNRREIWYGLVTNPQTPLAILEQALASPYTELWQRIYNHPVMVHNQHRPLLILLVSKIQQLIAPGNLPNWLRQVVFQYYTALPAAILEPFASSPYWEERYLAACHPHISTSVLNTLAHDGICYVQAIAQEMLKHRQPAKAELSDAPSEQAASHEALSSVLKRRIGKLFARDPLH